MKKSISASLFLVIGLALPAASCSQPAANNSAMNHDSVSNVNAMNHNSTPANSHDAHSGMNHTAMKSDANAASAPYDLQFIDTMIAHHRGAVDMAKIADGKTENPELKKFAAQIAADQEKEIAQMKEWREKWFAGKPRAINMEMTGMANSMKMDMSKLTDSKDKTFDSAFIETMIPHHEGAVLMAKEALQKSEKPEIKTLAQNIIKTQETEIKMMNDWKTNWAK